MSQTRDEFLLAGRRQGGWFMAMSVAATWIWAPALFVSSQQAYENGLAGVFYFCFCNTITLGIFGWVAQRADRQLKRQGYTFPQVIRERFDKKTHAIYLLVFLSVLLCSFATQLLAASSLLATYTGAPPLAVSVFITGLVLSYSLYRGLVASIATDVVQLAVVYVGALVVVPLAISRAGGFHVVQSGLGGVSGGHLSPLDAKVFLSFGVFVSINHLFALYADQMHWQRAFAIRAGEQSSTYRLAMLCFLVVPVGLSLLGFLAAGLARSGQLVVKNPGLVGSEVIQNLLPGWAMAVFALVILCGLMSTLDSIVMALASIASVDLLRSPSDGGGAKELRRIRIAMVVMSLLGLGLASVPGITILGMFLFYGMLRLAVATPTLAVIFDARVTARGLFSGVLLAVVVAVPVYLVGVAQGSLALKLGATLVAVLASGGVTLLLRAPGPRTAAPLR
jgi:Na+/proline symporter